MAHDPEPDVLAALREEYSLGGLAETDLDPDPVVMLRRWTDDAVRADLRDPTAMVLSTVSADGVPSSRTVLCKGMSPDGLVFYSNYASAKARDLAGQERCALLFPWYPLQRQVRVEGTARRAPAELSDAYFASRPRASQLGAWASPQSDVVASREVLDGLYDEAERRFDGGPVPRPEHWGGYVVVPDLVEFWQGRRGRLHDRLRYRRTSGGPGGGGGGGETEEPGRSGGPGWLVERLAP